MTQTLDKYQLHELLGSGATADVYRATDQTLGREVALKLLKPSLVSDATAFNRFMQEARAAAVLFHPYIATVYEMGESEGRFFIAMRYIPGLSLNHALEADGPLPWEQVHRMAAQLGEALDFAHNEGFLHRDVKPSNIICSDKGDYVLTDFGLVRAMANTGMTTHTGALLGTPAYIAPEIWNGEEASPASDQYALACVLYEAITGETLFTGATPQAIITNHLIKGPEFATSWPDGIPERGKPVLKKALAAESAERYDSIAHFTNAIIDQDDLLIVATAPENDDRKKEDAITPVSVNAISDEKREEPFVQESIPESTHTMQETQAEEIPTVSKKSRSPYLWGSVALLLIAALVVVFLVNSSSMITKASATATYQALAMVQATATENKKETQHAISLTAEAVSQAQTQTAAPTITQFPTATNPKPTATKTPILPTSTPTSTATDTPTPLPDGLVNAPDLIGLSLSEAKAILEGEGIKYDVGYTQVETEENVGKIAIQEPAGGIVYSSIEELLIRTGYRIAWSASEYRTGGATYNGLNCSKFSVDLSGGIYYLENIRDLADERLIVYVLSPDDAIMYSGKSVFSHENSHRERIYVGPSIRVVISQSGTYAIMACAEQGNASLYLALTQYSTVDD